MYNYYVSVYIKYIIYMIYISYIIENMHQLEVKYNTMNV